MPKNLAIFVRVMFIGSKKTVVVQPLKKNKNKLFWKSHKAVHDLLDLNFLLSGGNLCSFVD